MTENQFHFSFYVYYLQQVNLLPLPHCPSFVCIFQNKKDENLETDGWHFFSSLKCLRPDIHSSNETRDETGSTFNLITHFRNSPQFHLYIIISCQVCFC